MDAPRIQYAKTEDGVSIAFTIIGSGPVLILADGVLDGGLDARISGRSSRLYAALSSSRSLVLLDWRNTGLSASSEIRNLNALKLDLRAVADHLGLEVFDLGGRLSQCHVAVAFAAENSSRVRKLVLLGPRPAGSSPRRTHAGQLTSHFLRSDWQQFTDLYGLYTGGWSESGREIAESLRKHWTPEGLDALFSMIEEFDATPLAPGVKAPTLIVADENKGAREYARTLASSIRMAHLIQGDRTSGERMISVIDEFLELSDDESQRETNALYGVAFRTILFTDIEGHTAMMHRLGDTKGRDVLREHERISREALRAHGGTEVKTIGDSFMASFPSAQKAVECAIELQRAFESTDCAGERLRIRVGINAGEPIADENDLFGSSVILASRTKEKAAGGEIFVTDVVRQLVAGKGFAFTDRGEMEMKGFEEPVRLYEVRWQEAAG